MYIYICSARPTGSARGLRGSSTRTRRPPRSPERERRAKRRSRSRASVCGRGLCVCMCVCAFCMGAREFVKEGRGGGGGTDNRSEGTDNRSKGTDNRSKGTDNRSKCTDKRAPAVRRAGLRPSRGFGTRAVAARPVSGSLDGPTHSPAPFAPAACHRTRRKERRGGAGAARRDWHAVANERVGRVGRVAEG